LKTTAIEEPFSSEKQQELSFLYLVKVLVLSTVWPHSPDVAKLVREAMLHNNKRVTWRNNALVTSTKQARDCLVHVRRNLKCTLFSSAFYNWEQCSHRILILPGFTFVI